MDNLIKTCADIWFGEGHSIPDNDGRMKLLRRMVETVLEDDKRLEALYCIEGDYTGEDRPIALALWRLNAATTMVARQRDTFREELLNLKKTIQENAQR